MAGQQLVQMPDGKLQVLTTTQIQQAAKAQPAAKATVIKSSASTVPPAGKLVLQTSGSPQPKAVQQPVVSPTKTQQILVKQQASPVVQKIAATAPAAVVVSGGQVLQQQVVVSQQQVGGASGQQVSVYFFLLIYKPSLYSVIGLFSVSGCYQSNYLQQPGSRPATVFRQAAGGLDQRSAGADPADGQRAGASRRADHAAEQRGRRFARQAGGGSTAAPTRAGAAAPAAAQESGAGGRRQPDRPGDHGATAGGPAARNCHQVRHGPGHTDHSGAEDRAAGTARFRLHAEPADRRPAPGQTTTSER